MAEPYNYNIASPTDAFQKAYAFGDAITQRQQQDAQAQAARVRAQQSKAALESIVTDRSPENISRNLLLFPELKEQITASESVLNEAQRNSDNQFRAEVIGFAKGGNIEAARERLAKQAEGYANTPGKEQQAAAAQALLKTFDINPDSVLLPMTIQLAQSDEKLYKTITEGPTGLDTPFLKELVAEGLRPGTPEFKSALQAKREGDPYIAVSGVGLFLKSDVTKAAAQGKTEVTPLIPQAAITMLKNDPKLAADFDRKYRTDDNPNPSARILGGQTGAPSGNFR
jgi:hypothetical protein